MANNEKKICPTSPRMEGVPVYYCTEQCGWWTNEGCALVLVGKKMDGQKLIDAMNNLSFSLSHRKGN